MKFEVKEALKLVDYIGEPALLEQTAEECMELGFACLKLARMLRGENKVHGHSREELEGNLMEEMGDVEICLEELFKAGLINHEDVSYWVVKKKRRMKERLEAEGK